MNTGQPKCTTYKNCRTLSISDLLEESTLTGFFKTSPCSRKTFLWNCSSVEKKSSETAEFNLSIKSCQDLKYLYGTIQLTKRLLTVTDNILCSIFPLVCSHTLFTFCNNCVLSMWSWLPMAYMQQIIILSYRLHHIWFTYLNNISYLFKSPWTGGVNLKNRANSMINTLENFCLTMENYIHVEPLKVKKFQM